MQERIVLHTLPFLYRHNLYKHVFGETVKMLAKTKHNLRVEKKKISSETDGKLELN